MRPGSSRLAAMRARGLCGDRCVVVWLSGVFGEGMVFSGRVQRRWGRCVEVVLVWPVDCVPSEGCQWRWGLCRSGHVGDNIAVVVEC